MFCLIAAAALLPLLLRALPSRNDQLRRLDRNSGAARIGPPPRSPTRSPATTDDGHAVALWRAHIERALRSAKTLRAGLPMPRVAARDPMALRALVLVLVIATFFVAGGDRMRRVNAAFDWHGVIAPANFRIDAWVSPPPYTGKPPLILQGLRPGEPVQAAERADRGAGRQHAGDPRQRPGQARRRDHRRARRAGRRRRSRRPAAAPTERRFAIDGDGTATVRAVAAIWPGSSPPSPTGRRPSRSPASRRTTPNGLQLSYKLEDDYGVVGAQAIFKLMSRRGTNGHPPRNLYDAPEFAARRCRRRAPAAASGAPPAASTSIPGPAPTCR